MKEIAIENWSRKAQYEFFSTYEDPFFNVTANLNVTNLYSFCKKHDLSFSLACIFVAIKSINEIPELKLRIKNKKVVQYDSVPIGSTILNEDFTFSFCDFPYVSSIFEFDTNGKSIIKKHKEGVTFDAQEDEVQMVHCSTLPWISLTGFKHARKGDEASKGIPKIIFGKFFTENNLKKIPFSVEVHHALVDGYHVGLLFKSMQQFIDELV
ncbi:CatA-like O-acetyltransferase [Lutibacter holmesii]|uniref:CatA-like O-acetyltransferase n=1 Tax=Lutibacter holmesii TaxID=1137985 RepID=A0ABW3WN58_9FLAO